MKLKDLLQDLALGDLSGSYLVENGTNQINPIHLPKVIHFINRSLENFYTMFPLKEQQIILQLINGVSTYYLLGMFALSNKQSNKIKYIMDSDVEPFLEDVIKIINVSTLDGRDFTIDDAYSNFNVFVPEYNCIRIPDKLDVNQIVVTYQAKHKLIDISESANSEEEINIPLPMYSAFSAYIACLILQSMGGGKLEESNALYAKYQTQVDLLKAQGVGLKPILGINIKPYKYGWI